MASTVKVRECWGEALRIVEFTYDPADQRSALKALLRYLKDTGLDLHSAHVLCDTESNDLILQAVVCR